MKGHDPNSSRMLAESLGTEDSGCQCQTEWIVLWENGKIKDKELVSDNPLVLKNLENSIKNGCVEEFQKGRYRYKIYDHLYPSEKDRKNELNELDFLVINGKKYHKEYCNIFDESMWSCEDDLISFLKDKKYGEYTVLIELACYTYCYGFERQNCSDSAFKILED